MPPLKLITDLDGIIVNPRHIERKEKDAEMSESGQVKREMKKTHAQYRDAGDSAYLKRGVFKIFLESLSLRRNKISYDSKPDQSKFKESLHELVVRPYPRKIFMTDLRGLEIEP